MKYTFVDESGHSREVKIDDKELTTLKCSIGGTLQEAINLWLFDHDYISNDTVDELTKKAKENKCGSGRVDTKKGRKPPVRKEDPVKRYLIQHLLDSLYEDGLVVGLEDYTKDEVGNIEVTNPERVITFSIGEDRYELTLSKKRKLKKVKLYIR